MLPPAHPESVQTHDVEPPENCFQFSQIRFRKVRARVRRAIIHAANLQRQRIRLWRHHQIRAQAPKLLRQPVANIQRHAQRRRGHSHPQSQCSQGQQFTFGPARKGIGNKSKEHLPGLA